MGFWSSFLGHAAVEVAKDMKQQEKETQRWNDLFHELGQYETAFNNYLSSVGIQDTYIADVEYVNSGNIMPAKREMDELKRKVEKFISFGGQGKYLYRLEDIDDAIETVKYLKAKGYLHRQEEFLSLGLSLTQSTLEREIREDKGIKILLDSPHNELADVLTESDMDFVAYDDLTEGDAIKIDTAQVYDEEIIEFLQFKTVAVKFTKEHIYIYSYNEHNQIFYKRTISNTQKVEMSAMAIPAVDGWALVNIDGLEVMFSMEKADEVRAFYIEHNSNVDSLNAEMKKKINGDSAENTQIEKRDMPEFEPFSVSGAKLWNSEAEEFQDLKLTITFSTTKISMYTAIYGQDFFAQDFPEGSHIDTEVIDINNPEQSVLRFTSLLLLMDTEDAKKVKDYYDRYEEGVEGYTEQKQDKIKEISNEIDGIDDMAMNMLNMTDEHILLNHDTVICLQTLLAHKKFRDVKLWDEDSLNSENTLLGVAVIKSSLDNIVEIVQENYSEYTEEEIRFAGWEAIKRVSVKFYSDMWEQKYGKYIDEPLKPNATTEADGTLDKYIEEVIRCNEIDDTDVWVMGIFTYYIMDKGYATGEMYFPPYYEVVIKAFSTIRDNIKKSQYKEKLKGTVKKQETHYTIDDVDMMNGSEFEHFVCELYTKMGYKAEVTKQSGDQGLDVIAEKGDKRIGIQAKCYSGTVGNSAVQEAVAGRSFYHCDKVVVVTNNYFTASAKELAQSNDVILWDRDILKEKIKENM